MGAGVAYRVVSWIESRLFGSEEGVHVANREAVSELQETRGELSWIGLGWVGFRLDGLLLPLLRLNAFGVNAVFDWGLGLGVGVTTDHWPLTTMMEIIVRWSKQTHESLTTILFYSMLSNWISEFFPCDTYSVRGLCFLTKLSVFQLCNFTGVSYLTH